MLVVDASVVVKWFVPEERRPEARAILVGGEPLCAPALIVGEVATGLSKKVRLGQLPSGAGKLALEGWAEAVRGGVIEFTPDAELMVAAYGLSIELDHQLPDCLYLALARHAQCPLVTADEKMSRKARGLKGVEVRLL